MQKKYVGVNSGIKRKKGTTRRSRLGNLVIKHLFHGKCSGRLRELENKEKVQLSNPTVILVAYKSF